jgi:hypothetical protein
MACLFCETNFRSAFAQAQHLDTSHPAWVKRILRHIGVELPDFHPAPKRRAVRLHGFPRKLARSV